MEYFPRKVLHILKIRERFKKQENQIIVALLRIIDRLLNYFPGVR